MLELLKRLHLKVERFFEERKREADWGRAILLLIVVSFVAGFLTSSGSAKFFFTEYYLLTILFGSVIFFVLGKLVGGRGSFLALVYCLSICVIAVVLPYSLITAARSQLSFFDGLIWLFVGALVLTIFALYLMLVMVKQVHKISYLKALTVAIIGVLILNAAESSLLALTNTLPVFDIRNELETNSLGSYNPSSLSTGSNGCAIVLNSNWSRVIPPKMSGLRGYYSIPDFGSEMSSADYKGPEDLQFEEVDGIIFRDVIPFEEQSNTSCNSFAATLRTSIPNSSIKEIRTDWHQDRFICIVKLTQNTAYWYFGKGKFDDADSYVLTYYSKEPSNEHFEEIMKTYNCR